MGNSTKDDTAIPFDDLSLEELLTLPIDPNTINILESHIHKAGEWMIGYKFKFMDMNGNLDGSSNRSTASILADFPITPTSMTMEMHMASLMYAPTDDLTLMVMAPYKRLSMDHVNRSGRRFTTRSEGLGDVKARVNYAIYRQPFDRHLVSVTGGLSFPTGSIEKKDDTPAGSNQKLPYPMQLGSGTYDLLAGISYVGLFDDWYWGLRTLGTVPLGKNNNKYRLGKRLEVSSWMTHQWTDWLSGSLRLDGQWWGNIDGADPDLNPLVISTADPNRRGGVRLDVLLGFDLFIPTGTIRGHRIGIEGGVPIYQSLDGPQLETDWQMTIGWQWLY